MFAYVGCIRKYARSSSIAVIFLILSSVPIQAQYGVPPVADTVVRSSQQATRYADEFKNLLGREIKTVRTFDKNESVKKERVIVSNFLVYELLRNRGSITEFRTVVSVDGKPVPEAEKRTVQLFERVSKAQTSADELERIQKESLRYDEEIQIVGLTLFQGIALDERVRDAFKFEVVGREKLNETEAYILEYRQIKDTDMIRISGKPGAAAVLDYDYDVGELRNARPRLRGRLWIEINSYRIVREVRELLIQADGFEKPVLIAANEFDFSPSEFGINTPRRIVHSQFRIDPKNRRAFKDVEYQFLYSDFARPKVEVTSDKPGAL
jgi:hypothetical protein